jgi:hypothetical protein
MFHAFSKGQMASMALWLTFDIKNNKDYRHGVPTLPFVLFDEDHPAIQPPPSMYLKK